MSPETIQLLTSSDAIVGYLLGAAGLLVVAIVSLLRPRPVPVAGLVIAAVGMVGIDRLYSAPTELTGGVVLLALGGLVPVKSDVAVMALSLPGATVLGYLFVDLGHPELIVFVVAGVAVLGPMSARFDKTHPDGLGTSLMVIAYVAALVLVPDTELVIVVCAAAMPIVFAGYPLRLARLGRSGALASSGLLFWVVAIGGAARFSAVVAGAGILGILIADPVARRLRAPLSGSARADSAPVVGIAVQAGIGIALAIAVDLASHQSLLIGLLVLGLLGASGYWSTSPPS